ncbi:hypothetical protein SLA2020_172940 [Shorea laevis]
MDSTFNRFPYSENGFEFGDGVIFSDPNGYQNVEISNVFESNNQSLGLSSSEGPFVPDSDYFSSSNSASFLSMEKEGDSSFLCDDSDFEDTVLKYISQVLMEEDMEEKPCMFPDALALQAAEKSLYEVLGEKYPPIDQTQTPFCGYQGAESPDNCSSGIYSDQNSYGSSSGSTSSPIDLPWNVDFLENSSRPSFLETPIPPNFVFQSTPNSTLPSSLSSRNNFSSNGNRVLGSSVSELVIPNFFSESELALQFNKGVEEASKFLPKANLLTIAVENIPSAPEMKEKTIKTAVKAEQDDREHSPTRLTVKKNHAREDEELEEWRSKKQSAVSVDENGLLEMFDKLEICGGRKDQHPSCILDQPLQNGQSKTLQQKEQTNGSNGGKTRGKKQQENKKEVVDLRTLLIVCAQAVSSNDIKTANEQLKQIRQHSSQFGDWSQRLAHIFADALEARMAGTGTQIYTALTSKRKSAADILKSYQLYISTCPFLKFAFIFANHHILELIKGKKVTTLHIIDFGIFYGFQWAALIMRLSELPGGPPKLRITGIEFPQRGFRPAEAVQNTGRRLARFCEKVNVPFEYNAIAQKWETIRIEDLKIRPNESVVVNSQYRFKNLLDETVVVNNPRDTVLKLIRRINPDMFVHSIVNGTYNAPFFVTRFKEVLFHYSGLFDIFDASIPREDEIRLMFETEIFAREVMNVVACEGTERIERPETYKKWLVRTMRAGFVQRRLDPKLLNYLKCKAKDLYHRHSDFMVERDGQWMLQGWKGRILYASSVWLPA